jgi:hypothetical protein
LSPLDCHHPGSGRGRGFGSGGLDNSQIMGKTIAAESTIKYVQAHDGVLMFGDSIAVQDGEALATRLMGRSSGSPTRCSLQ